MTEPAELPAALTSFLAGDFAESDAADLAHQELYVEEQVLGQATSRFVKEGGVRLAGVKSYLVTAADLEAMAVQPRGRPEGQPELLKFRFMIDPLPPGRQYTSVSVRIALQPPAAAFLLKPLPVATAVNDGAEGFGWTFQAQDGVPHEVIAIAMIELPRGTRVLSGLFDTEALITRRVLARPIERPAAPVNAAVPFTVDLGAKPLGEPS